MLVLSRRTDEEIVIDGQIRIRVLAGSRGKVRLGITAPDDVQILRPDAVRQRTLECFARPDDEISLLEC